MKVAYCYHKNNKHTYAGDTIAVGFANAFQDMGYTFRFFDTNKLRGMSAEKLKMYLYGPDMIFTSVENINLLPLDLLKQKKIVLWGQFYTPCDYEEQIHCINTETKQLLTKYQDKHDILIWSQHEDHINERFFAGYEKELGLRFTKLMHAADKTRYATPIKNPKYDFIWTGNISHRQRRYNDIIGKLKTYSNLYLDFNEHNRMMPDMIVKNEYYRKSLIAPNIHTKAQIQHQILLNERVFTSPLLGSLQICDNLLARKYFEENELIVATNNNDFIDAFLYYRKHYEERINMINKMASNVLVNHSYHNRVETIINQFN